MLVRSALREYKTWSSDSRFWNMYGPRSGDIVIGTAPKCGTTWMQQIVASLVFQDDTPRSLPAMSPWLEASFRSTAPAVHRLLDEQTHRRFIKTHLPLDAIPLHDDVRYIHVARDGRDVAMSGHNHFGHLSPAILAIFDRVGREEPSLGRPFPRPPSDPAEYFRQWITTTELEEQTEGGSLPSFFDLENSYWAERKRPNILLVHYNDLQADRDAEMRRVAAFLGIPIDEGVWPKLVRAAGFDEMRSAGTQLMPQTKAMFLNGEAERFFFRGTNGRWRGILTAEDLALYDAKIREKFMPALAAWVAGGRQVAGDPREIG